MKPPKTLKTDRRIRIFHAVSLALLLGGCGASPEAPAARDATPPAPTSAAGGLPGHPEGRVILAFGDSLTAGHMVEADASWPALLQARLDDLGYEYVVVNDGESGLTTSGGLARLERALGLEPEVVILELGGNDGLRGTRVDVIRENLLTIAQSFQDTGAQVVLAGITLPRNYGPDYIRDFESVYAEVAEALDLDLIPFLLEGLVDPEAPEAAIGSYMQSDGIHPTAAGYVIVADTIFRAIEPYLEEASGSRESARDPL